MFWIWSNKNSKIHKSHSGISSRCPCRCESHLLWRRNIQSIHNCNEIVFRVSAIPYFQYYMTDRFFGLLIICASCGMRFIKNNYLFLMTGMGKGFFNVFVGSLLCSINKELLNLIMGPCIMGSGLIFIFLSMFKNMSDDELQRAVSVQK